MKKSMSTLDYSSLGKQRKSSLKLTSRRTLSQSDMLYVPSIIVKIKVSFESNKIIMTRIMFCGKETFCKYITKIINESSSSSTYLIDLYDMRHARLWHINKI
ncbi:hypothetical protein CR513_21547, partial [Mucuna pruriens]